MDRVVVTEQERQVLERLVNGEAPRAIAAAMKISHQRVSQLMSSLRVKGFLTRDEEGELVVNEIANS
jgi:FixJ family two-component response regulator